MEQGDFVDVGQKGIGSPKELILVHLNRMSQNIFAGSPSQTFSEGKSGLTISPDKRETFILATDFLVGITNPYYDEKMKEKQTEFDTSLTKEDDALALSSITTQAIYYAQKYYTVSKFDVAREYWKKELLRDKIFSITKPSAYYEYYMSQKYKIYFKLFIEINFLLFRKKWLVIEDYSEDEE